MRALRFALALLALAFAATPAMGTQTYDCTSAFWSPSTQTCGFTGETGGPGGCYCQYTCEYCDGQYNNTCWYNFCGS